MSHSPFAFHLLEREGGIRHGDGIVGRIHAEHSVSRYIHHLVEMTRMIVAEEYEVEARHLTRDFLRGILLVGGCFDASRLSRMEQSDDDI